MKTVGELGAYILGSFKDEEAGRVALYHYLKNFCTPQDAVTPEVLNTFFAECLQLPHWQEKKSELYSDIQELLQKFFSQVGNVFSLDKVWDLSRFQLVHIIQAENLYAIVKSFETASLKEKESLRIIPESETRVVIIKKELSGSIIVRSYNNLTRVSGANLIPIMPDQELHYDAGLELQLHRFQRLKPAPHSQVRFNINEHQINAQVTSGFAFRQCQIFRLQSLNEDPRIFYPLKRLERFYVHRPSDPYYMELMATLDQAAQMLHNKTDGACTFAQQAFACGQMALDQLFPDDKALYFKLKELVKMIAQVPKSSRFKEVENAEQIL